jgi:uncharacterized protein YuzE
MKIKYDTAVDAMYITFTENKIVDSEDKAGIILDYDATGSIVGIEILNASNNIDQPDKVELEVI